jgi:hypothetical protein
VRLERAHAQFLGQGEGLLVAGFGLIALWRLTSCRNLAEEAQSIGLVAAFLVFLGECQCALGEGLCLLQTAIPQIRLPQGETSQGEVC